MSGPYRILLPNRDSGGDKMAVRTDYLKGPKDATLEFDSIDEAKEAAVDAFASKVGPLSFKYAEVSWNQVNTGTRPGNAEVWLMRHGQTNTGFDVHGRVMKYDDHGS